MHSQWSDQSTLLRRRDRMSGWYVDFGMFGRYCLTFDYVWHRLVPKMRRNYGKEKTALISILISRAWILKYIDVLSWKFDLPVFKTGEREHVFQFSHVYPPYSTQMEVYEGVAAPMISGIACCTFRNIHVAVQDFLTGTTARSLRMGRRGRARRSRCWCVCAVRRLCRGLWPPVSRARTTLRCLSRTTWRGISVVWCLGCSKRSLPASRYVLLIGVTTVTYWACNFIF